VRESLTKGKEKRKKLYISGHKELALPVLAVESVESIVIPGYVNNVD
jgi:hypothetical protein